MNINLDNLNKLYRIEGECPEWLYEAIDVLRQLTNEEFVHKGKQITSQTIYNILYPKIQKGMLSDLKKDLDNWAADHDKEHVEWARDWLESSEEKREEGV